jgi:hypothetical protein
MLIAGVVAGCSAPHPIAGNGAIAADGELEPTAAATFRHPGVLVDQGQLDFVKAKIAAGAEPWTSALQAAQRSRYAALTYRAKPVADVDCGPFSNPNHGCSDEQADAIAAYTQSLLWYYTGNETYAQNAAAILDAWAATIQKHTNSNAPLQSAWTGAQFPRAGEILRATYAAWPSAHVAAFARMLRTIYLPEVINGAPNDNGNWELTMADATIAIGVFLDDKATFDKGVAMWRRRVPAYIYLSSDGTLPVPPPGGNKGSPSELIAYWYNQSTFVDGLGQETCRDFGHLTLGFAAMINAAETARIQKIDLYSEQMKRIIAGLEFNAQYLAGAPVPSWLCSGSLNLPGNPTWEIGYNALALRLEQPLPHTLSVIEQLRPTGATHHIAWETLTHGEIGNAGIE